MKKLMFLMLALFIGVSASAQTLPDVKVENQEGKVISIREVVDGTPMIISFWSTTCKPCIMELNAINESLYEWLDEVDMKVVAVSVDDARTLSRARAMEEVVAAAKAAHIHSYISRLPEGYDTILSDNGTSISIPIF